MAIPKLYETDGIPFDKKKIPLIYYRSMFNQYWLIAEMEGDTAFGYANLGDDQNAEWGYISISELESIGVMKKEVKFGGINFKKTNQIAHKIRKEHWGF